MKTESMAQGFPKGFPICAAFLFLLVLTSGCAGPTSTVRTYSGDKLPESEVAVIRGWWYMLPPIGYRCIDIYRVDDSYPKAIKVELLPGRHELIIRDYVISLSPWAHVPGCSQSVWAAINFEAGHEYKIETLYKGILEEGIKIVDVTTGTTILSQPWGVCPEVPLAEVYFSACIQPLPGRHGTWNTDEVNRIRGVIAMSAQRHGLKQKRTEERGYIAWYSLPKKFFDLRAHYTNPPAPGISCGYSLNTKDQTGAIFFDLRYASRDPTITYLEREEAESVWKEIYELLQNNFGERVMPIVIP